MAKMRAIDAAVHVLEREGVTAAFGVPGAAINPLYSALKARGSIVEYDYPGFGPVKTASNPIKLSDAPFEVRRLAPRVGEHTIEIMRDVGYSDGEIDALRDAKAVGAP